MAPQETCLVNRAILDALRDSEAALMANQIEVRPELDATLDIATAESALYEAIYALFRSLPERLARGTTLFVSTVDRAGGDIELTWEARERDAPDDPDASPQEALRHGPHSDLLELALAGLETLCRVRASVAVDHDAGEARPVEPDQTPLARRRYLFLIPSLSRPGGYEPDRGSSGRAR